MFIHPYHLRLMHALIRKKVKGDHRIKLTVADREQLVDTMQLSISKSHIVKVLNEGKRKPVSLSQHTLDQVVRVVDHENWNAFLQTNPVPSQYFYKLMSCKSKTLLSSLVETRILELKET